MRSSTCCCRSLLRGWCVVGCLGPGRSVSQCRRACRSYRRVCGLWIVRWLCLDGSRNAARRVFFFQAEDGIRDVAVTGVQTCALPISLPEGELAPLEGAVSSVADASGKGRDGTFKGSKLPLWEGCALVLDGSGAHVDGSGDRKSVV